MELTPESFASLRLAWTLWMLGYPDQALTRSQEALTLASESCHAYSLAFALNFAALLHQWRRERESALEKAEATIALSREQGFVYWLAVAMFIRGWALVEQGLVEKGIEDMRQGMTGCQSMRAALGEVNRLFHLAEAYGKQGHAEAGLHILADALSTVHKPRNIIVSRSYIGSKGNYCCSEPQHRIDLQRSFSRRR